MIKNKIDNALFIITHLLKVGQEVFREDGEPVGKITQQEEDEALGLLYDLAKKADKYRWHDLRKNPEDLPKIGRRVDTRTSEGLSFYNWRDLYNNDIPCWKSHDSSVIAWREIEPFEEGE